MSERYLPRLLPYFLLVFIQVGVFFSILPHWQTTDQATWVSNGIKFEQALLQHNWPNTRLTTRPGVTVEWVVGITSRLVFGKTVLQHTLPDDLAQRPIITTAARIAMASALLVLNLFTFYFLKKLLSFKPAFAVTLLLSLHPILTNSGFLVWTDMFLVYFLFLPVLTFLLYIKNYLRRYIFLTGLFFGLALLTKVIAWVLLPLLLMIVIFNQPKHRLLNAVGLAVLVALSIFYILYPAMWLHPGILFDRVHEVDVSYTSPQAIHSDQPLWQYVLYIFLIDPLLITFSLVVVYIIARQWSEYKSNKLAITFFSSALIYLLAVTATSLLKDNGLFSIRSDRYIAPLIPFLLTGSFYFLHKLNRRWLLELTAICLALLYLFH